jgi:hypothetical protein
MLLLYGLLLLMVQSYGRKFAKTTFGLTICDAILTHFSYICILLVKIISLQQNIVL